MPSFQARQAGRDRAFAGRARLSKRRIDAAGQADSKKEESNAEERQQETGE
jgi:hypothetical protein